MGRWCATEHGVPSPDVCAMALGCGHSLRSGVLPLLVTSLARFRRRIPIQCLGRPRLYWERLRPQSAESGQVNFGLRDAVHPGTAGAQAVL